MSEAAIESIQFLVNEKIAPAELKSLEERYQTKKVLQNEKLAITEDEASLFFQYALALIQSPYRSDWPKGRQIMEYLYKKNTADKVARRDYLFYCAIAELKMKNYKEAQEFVNAILYVEPFNHQAKALQIYINKMNDKDLLIGAGVIGGVAAVGAILLGAMLAKK